MNTQSNENQHANDIRSRIKLESSTMYVATELHCLLNNVVKEDSLCIIGQCISSVITCLQ